MANNNQPNGLKPHGRVLRIRPYTTSAICYPGDALTLGSDGCVAPAATGALVGVCMSYAASGSTGCLVADDPNQLFEVQADTAIAAADVGLNATLQGSANTTYKRSGQNIQASTINTTSTLSLQILANVPQVDNAVNATYNDVIVRINVHQLNNAGRAGI